MRKGTLKLNEETIRKLRENKGWSQETLAEKVGSHFSKKTVERAESGHPVHNRTAGRLAEALGVSVADLQQPHPAVAPTTNPPVLDRQTHDAPRGARGSNPHNLPASYTSFIGRKSEIREIKRLFASLRLVTLTGTGGVGKTQLASQCAAELLKMYRDGVWFVDLAPRKEPDLVPQICTVLCLGETGQKPIDLLASYLRAKCLLLILDNCEHMIRACADVIDKVMRECPEVKVLTTSRQPLGLKYETLLDVDSLEVPDAEKIPSLELLSRCDSVQLFVDRATSKAGKKFTLSNENAKAVAQICHKLDGIPLAIELAAAQTRAYSPEQIVTLLRDRFELLTDGDPTAPPKHQTLRASVDWSHDLLSDTEKVAFRRLSVFVGGWSLAGAKAAAAGGMINIAAVPNLLSQLVQKSLIKVAKLSDREGDRRYFFLETLREYALEKLIASDDESSVRNVHCAFCRSIAEEGEREMYGAEQQSHIIPRLSTEHGNFLAAFEWANKREVAVDDGVRLVGALFQFWYVRADLTEGRNWSRAMLDRARVVAQAQSNSEAELWSNETVDQKRWRARAAQANGGLAYVQGDLSPAYEQLQRSIDLATEIEDEKTKAVSLSLLAFVNLVKKNVDTAARSANDAREAARRVKEPWVSALALLALGEVLRYQNDLKAAEVHYKQSLTFLECDTWISAFCNHNLAYLALKKGDTGGAVKLFGEALSTAKILRHRQVIALSIAGFGVVAAAEGRFERAATLFGAADALREEAGGLRVDPIDEAEIDPAIKAATDKLGETKFPTVWKKGRAMSLEKAVEFAVRDGVRRTRAKKNKSKRPRRHRRIA